MTTSRPTPPKPAPPVWQSPKPPQKKAAGPQPADYAVSSDGSVRVLFEIITPEIAAEYLGLNLKNRSLSEVLAATYSQDMAKDKWYLNTDAIGFDSTGALMNGQHRLTAVIESGKAVEMMVVYGLDEKSRATTDIGRKRTVADELKMRGITNNNQIAAAVRMRLQYENKTIGLTQSFRYSNAEIIEWAGVWEEEFQGAIKQAKNVYKNCKVSPTVLACAYSIFNGIDVELAEHYYGKLASGENVSGTILTVMKKLQAQSTSRAKLPPPFLLWILIRGWNALRHGESLERIITPDSASGNNMMEAK